MTEIWIGECHLRAKSAERQRWIGGLAQGRGILLLHAASRQDFEQGLRQALGLLGYELLAVTDAGPVDEAAHLVRDPQKLAGLLPHVSRTRPLPLGEFEPIETAANWHEVDWNRLFADRTPLWAVVDGVGWPDIQKVLSRTAPEHACLYSTLNPESRSMAPWLARVEPGSAFANILRERPQTDHAFILFQSHAEIGALRRHLRHFTMLKTPADENAAVYFRFYDPRVLIDAVEAMRASFLARFTLPMTAFIAPLTPFCLLPKGAELAGELISPFTDVADCQGRLLAWTVPPFSEPQATDLKVTHQEFEVFSDRMERRATYKLAHALYDEHRDLTNPGHCLSVASGAKSVAAAYGLTTVKQVTIVARSMLFFGNEFAVQDSEARRILNDPALLPWQKKNKLIDWFVAASRSKPWTGIVKG